MVAQHQQLAAVPHPQQQQPLLQLPDREPVCQPPPVLESSFSLPASFISDLPVLPEVQPVVLPPVSVTSPDSFATSLALNAGAPFKPAQLVLEEWTKLDGVDPDVLTIIAEGYSLPVQQVPSNPGSEVAYTHSVSSSDAFSSVW